MSGRTILKIKLKLLLESTNIIITGTHLKCHVSRKPAYQTTCLILWKGFIYNLFIYPSHILNSVAHLCRELKNRGVHTLELMGQLVLGTINNKQLHDLDTPEESKNIKSDPTLSPIDSWTFIYLILLRGFTTVTFAKQIVTRSMNHLKWSSQGSAPAAPWRSERNFCDNSESKSASNDRRIQNLGSLMMRKLNLFWAVGCVIFWGCWMFLWGVEEGYRFHHLCCTRANTRYGWRVDW